MIDIDEIERLAKAAKPGKRTSSDHNSLITDRGWTVLWCYAEASCGRPLDDYYKCNRPGAEVHLKFASQGDEDFIKALDRETVLALIAQFRAALSVVEEARKLRVVPSGFGTYVDGMDAVASTLDAFDAATKEDAP